MAVHSLLKRQLKRYFGDSYSIPQEWQPFVSAVNNAYQQFDTDRAMLERSLELSSQELLQTNSELRAVFSAIPDLMLRIDEEETILDYAAGNTDDLAFQPNMVLGKKIHDVALATVAAELKEAIHRVVGNGTPASIEYRLTAQQEERWFEARLLPLLDKQTIVIIRNITERKASEEALKNSEQRLASVIQSSPIPTFVIGRDHRVIYWNKALEELTQLKAAEIIGTSRHWTAFYRNERPCMADLLVDGDFGALSRWYSGKYHGSMLLNEAFEARDFFPTLGKGGRWLHFTAAVIRDSQGSLVGAMTTIQDFTDRKDAEEKYRSIFENAVDGLYQTSLDGHVLNANPAFARILHYQSAEEMCDLLKDISHQLYVRAERRQELLALIKANGVARDFEVEFYRKDRSIAWLTLNIRAVVNGTGETLYLEGLAQDITERKALEARLLQAQKMEAIGTLAGGIAHDFNNILAGIMGYIEITKSRLRQEELHGYLERVLKACERAKNLVAQILTFSRGAKQKIKPIDITPVTHEALKLLRASIPATITIRHKISPGLNLVLADPTQIHQVLINLCTNSAHAMREKGGLLEIGLENMEISSAAANAAERLKPGPHLKLTVRDTGSGIEPEALRRIFDPFFTTKGTGEGTGLGLSVVYGIVTGYGGDIAVESEPGKGSEFSVYLPAVREYAGAEQEPAGPLLHGQERILFVDDEENLAELGREMLQGLGYRVMAVTDSIRAMQLFRDHSGHFDLVITDMTMPGMTGLDLSREILKIRPNIPIILCTGYSELVTEQRAKAIGIQGFGYKPLNLANITRLISQVLNRNSARLAS